MPKPSLVSRVVRFDFDFEKFLAAVQYISSKELPNLDAYKICKLLFFADKYHLVSYGRPITGDVYCALRYGPVPSQALDLLNALAKGEDEDDENVKRMASRFVIDRRFRYPRFSTTDASGFSDLSKSDLMSLDEVINEFGKMNFNQLKSITHAVYAYKKTWEKGEHAMRYEDFFREDPDAIDGAYQEMLENQRLRRAFGAM